MKKFIVGLAAAVLSLGSILSAAERIPVTISGCVREGDARSFILTNVQEMSNGQMRPTTAIYWLSTTKGLKEHIGHRIEVNGTFSPSRDAGKTAKLSIETDGTTGEEKVAVENGMKKAEINGDMRPAGTAGVTTEITKPYRRLQVSSLKMIRAGCQ